jgi:signal transduction histidine kinase
LDQSKGQLQTNLTQISTIENLLEFYEHESIFDHRGLKLPVKRLKDYRSRDTNYTSKYALLNGKVLIISTSGAPSPYDIRRATEQLVHVFTSQNISRLELIWDVKKIEQPGIKIRKAIIESNRQLSTFINSRYLIVSPQYKTLIRIYKFIFERQVDRLFFTNTIEEALDAIFADRDFSEPNSDSRGYVWPDKSELLSKSKEELAEMILTYSEKHRQSTNKMLESLSHLSWGGRFKKIELTLSEEDPHYEMINAFSILQNDVEEIVREYKELNQNLELKVAERIVDFIDKESNLRSILDNSDRVTWLMNNRFELIDYNAAFVNEIKRRYLTSPKINDNVLDYISGEREKQVWRDRFESALKGKPGIYLDHDTQYNEERVWEIKTFPIKEVGKIKGVSVFIEDITQLKHSQLKLIEKNRDLQKVNSELDSFVYRVSHDLRAPLTSILGLISLMKIETNPEKVNEYICLQEKSIFKLDLFIKEIINLSRNSRLGITASEIDFEELIREIFESQHYSSSADNIARIVEIEDGLSFYTDRQRLSIILNNLISNGLKYVNPYEINPHIKLKVYSAPENKCIIEVSDNGIGISEMYLPKIFEMFFRATQEFSGSGLGLYIVKETVEKLKGKISVKSKMRQGSTFKVTLPNLKDRFDAAPKLED